MSAVQFDVPAVVPADPTANTSDILVERVKATPSLALFAVPDGDGSACGLTAGLSGLPPPQFGLRGSEFGLGGRFHGDTFLGTKIRFLPI